MQYLIIVTLLKKITVSKIIKQFSETRSITNIIKPGRPKSATDGNKSLEIMEP